MGNTREYQFINGPETSTLPSIGEPTVDTDTINLGYANNHYVMGRAPVADVTAIKALLDSGTYPRQDGEIVVAKATNAAYLFDAGNSETGDDLFVLTPSVGTGRWLRISENTALSAGYLLKSNADGKTVVSGVTIDASNNVVIPGTLEVQGATTYLNTTNTNIEDKLITLNKGGGATSATASGLEFEENSIITAYIKTSADRNNFEFLMPNKAGVISLLGQTGADTIALLGAGQTMAFGLGSVGSPSITFLGDLNTGIWSSGVDNLNFSTGGSEKLRIASSGYLGFGFDPSSLIHFTSTGNIIGTDSSGATGGNMFTFNAYYSAGLKANVSANRATVIEQGNTGVLIKASTGVQTANAALSTFNTYAEFGLGANDAIKFSTAGVQRLYVNADGDAQIGEITGPVSPTVGRKYLTIEGLTTTPAIIQMGNATGGAGVALGQLEWYNRDNSGSSSFRTAFMQAGVEGTTANNRGSYIVFATKADGVSGAGTTAFKINNTGSVEASLGTVTTPGYSFSGDLNTGMWSSGADNLSVSTAGVQRINVNADGDIQMGAIVAPVSSTAGRKYLTIEGLTTTPSVIQLGNATGGAAVALGQIEWYNRDNSGSSSFRTAFMQAGVEGTTANNRGSYIVFATKADGVSGAGTTAFKINNTGSVEASLGTVTTPGYSFSGDLNTGMWSSGADIIDFSTAGAQRLRIGSTGLIGVGATSLDGLITLQAQAATGTQIMKSFKNSAGNTRITELFDADNVRWIVGNRSSTALITLDEVNGQLGVGLTPTNRNNCHLQTVDGIGFPATQVASSDVNTLDDYEEGTFSPSVTSSAGTITTLGTVSGEYTKIGQLVFVRLTVAVTTNGTGSGEILVSNMPFTNGTAAGTYAVAYGRETSLTGSMIQGYQTGTTLHIVKYDNSYPMADGRSVTVNCIYNV